MVGFVQERLEVLQGAVVGMDGVVVGNVIAIVAQGRGIERQEPDAVNAQFLDVIQLPVSPAKSPIPSPLES